MLAVPGGIGLRESPTREGFIPGTRPCMFWGTGGGLQGHPWAAAECGGSFPSSSSRLPVLRVGTGWRDPSPELRGQWGLISRCRANQKKWVS